MLHAVLAITFLSLPLSVHPSHTGTVSKWMNIGSCHLHWRIAKCIISSFWWYKVYEHIPKRSPIAIVLMRHVCHRGCFLPVTHRNSKIQLKSLLTTYALWIGDKFDDLKRPWTDVRCLFTILVTYGEFMELTTPSRMEIGIHSLWEKCSPLSLISGDVRFINKESPVAMALNETVVIIIIIIIIITRTSLRYVRVFAVAIPSVCHLSVVCRLSVCL